MGHKRAFKIENKSTITGIYFTEYAGYSKLFPSNTASEQNG